MTRLTCKELWRDVEDHGGVIKGNARYTSKAPEVGAVMTLRQLAALITKRERAAAERMRERCRLVVLEPHVRAIAEHAPDEVVRMTGRIIDAIDELEPEEPSE